jgi:hypothetical protein
LFHSFSVVLYYNMTLKHVLNNLHEFNFLLDCITTVKQRSTCPDCLFIQEGLYSFFSPPPPIVSIKPNSELFHVKLLFVCFKGRVHLSFDYSKVPSAERSY